ncbi:ATP-grasp domain-containing protein, partial [Candidatus Woesearchaeota archaeon]|nr:ATP-grasp domain-containing protein [Candidatus Woesearchaeota archaeon]
KHIINFIVEPSVLEREPLSITIQIAKGVIKKERVVLLLGGSHFYAPAIKHIHEMGMKVLLVDRDPEPIGKRFADYFENINIVDATNVKRVAKAYDVDAVMAVNDYGVMTASKVSQALGLIGNPEEVALATTVKSVMRERWKEAGVPIPKFRIVKSLKEAIFAVDEIGGYPVILKPSGNMGASRGVRKVSSVEELKAAFKLSAMYDQSILVEEYLVGSEHSVEGLVYDGEVEIIAVSEKIKTPEPYRVDLAVIYPSSLTNEQLKQVEAAVIAAAKSLGIKNGAIHAEVCYTAQGPKLFEIASRPGGGRIPSDCVPLHNGVDMTKELVKVLLGISPSIKKRYFRGVVLGFIIAKPGVVVDISECERLNKLPFVHVCESLKRVGDRVGPVRAGGDRAGYFIVTGKTRDEALSHYFELSEMDIIKTKQVGESYGV